MIGEVQDDISRKRAAESVPQGHQDRLFHLGVTTNEVYGGRLLVVWSGLVSGGVQRQSTTSGKSHSDLGKCRYRLGRMATSQGRVGSREGRLKTVDANSPRWHRVTPSTFPWEDEAIDFLRNGITDSDPNRGWSNFEFVSGGVISEVDVLLLTRKGAFLIEIKSTPGRLVPATSSVGFRQADRRTVRDGEPAAWRQPQSQAPQVARSSTDGSRPPVLEARRGHRSSSLSSSSPIRISRSNSLRMLEPRLRPRRIERDRERRPFRDLRGRPSNRCGRSR